MSTIFILPKMLSNQPSSNNLLTFPTLFFVKPLDHYGSLGNYSSCKVTWGRPNCSITALQYYLYVKIPKKLKISVKKIEWIRYCQEMPSALVAQNIATFS